MEMNPGMIFDDLLPGESVATIGTNRPSEQLGPFRESQLRAVASGTGSSYSGASRNYNGTYSAQRQELVESWIGYEMAREDLISQFHRPVWRRFVDTAIAAGLVPLAGVDPMTMYRADFVGPAMPWIDPVKEVDAKVRAIGARLISRHMVIRESQYDPELIDEQIAADPYAPASGAGEAGEARDADEEIAA
jgi:lambda family phage portal protein